MNLTMAFCDDPPRDNGRDYQQKGPVVRTVYIGGSQRPLPHKNPANPDKDESTN
jgi:hypothetical protein